MTHPEPDPAPVTTWQAAEEVAAAWMRHWGYTDATLTGGSSDGGIDIRSACALAQVKFKAAPTGRGDVQNLVGAAGRISRTQLLFFSAAGYSKQAREYADEQAVALFTLAPFGAIEPANPAARMIIRRAKPAPSVASEGAEPAGTSSAGTTIVDPASRPDTDGGAALSRRGGCLAIGAALMLALLIVALIADIARGTFEPNEVAPALKVLGVIIAILASGIGLFTWGQRLDKGRGTSTRPGRRPPRH